MNRKGGGEEVKHIIIIFPLILTDFLYKLISLFKNQPKKENTQEYQKMWVDM